ncbi:profilin-4 isoform X4 [Loxodonta africana]|uniref:profilin-4 isoform X4 n=1 Tax=Loxodonta africana TaxID=9785 RepID=UPI0030D2047F
MSPGRSPAWPFRCGGRQRVPVAPKRAEDSELGRGSRQATLARADSVPRALQAQPDEEGIWKPAGATSPWQFVIRLTTGQSLHLRDGQLSQPMAVHVAFPPRRSSASVKG